MTTDKKGKDWYDVITKYLLIAGFVVFAIYFVIGAAAPTLLFVKDITPMLIGGGIFMLVVFLFAKDN
ncbi:MAG: hypothetical protein H6599_03800 [Flavobacteriales bacterium]|nr:hypothetical protein [Flavobacteriales bacterium]